MCFLVVEQLPGTDKARGCDHKQANPEKDEGEPVVTAKRPREVAPVSWTVVDLGDYGFACIISS